jgi:ElaB/YqjD/DUF883 family membrane-anchored ribosome-binding protein
MFTKKILAASNGLMDQGEAVAEAAIEAAQRDAELALEGLTHALQVARKHVAPALNGIGDQASALAHDGMDAMRSGAHQMRVGARHASDTTVAYIRDEPIKSMLIAAAAGAAVIGVVRLFSTPHRLR